MLEKYRRGTRYRWGEDSGEGGDRWEMIAYGGGLKIR